MNRRWIEMAVVLTCAAFALRSLGLIDATSLWSDDPTGMGFSSPSLAAFCTVACSWFVLVAKV